MLWATAIAALAALGGAGSGRGGIGRHLPAPSSDFYFPPSKPHFAYHNVATLGPCPRAVVENTTVQWRQLESMLTLGLPPNVTSTAFSKAMWDADIVVKVTGAKIFPGEWGKPGKPGVPGYATRLSFHVFNS